MILYQFSAIKWHQLLFVGLCIALLYSFFGAVSDARGQSFTEQVCDALDLNDRGCDLITIARSDPPARPWQISTTATAGGTSLQSPPTEPARSSCLIIGLEFQSPLVIRFSRRIDTERNDSLRFSLERDSVNLDIFSAGAGNTLREWEPQDFFIAHEGSDFLNLRFCFSTSFGGIGEQGRAWIDDMSILPLGEAPLSNNLVCQALDMSNEDCAQITTVTSEPPITPWAISTTATAGDYSLQSANIDDSQQSCLVFTVSFATPTLVQFMRRVNSQLADELHFVADGERQSYRLRPFSGTALRDWHRELYIVQPDVSRLSWCYTKDGSGSEGEDKAWIDDLSFASFEDATLNRELFCLVLDLSPQDCPLITSVTSDPPARPWQISTTATAGDYSLQSPPTGPAQSSCLIIGLEFQFPLVIRFSRRIDTERNDSLRFSLERDSVNLDIFSAGAGNTLREWEPQDFFIAHEGSDFLNLRFCFSTSFGGIGEQGRAWIDDMSILPLGEAPLSNNLVCQALDMSNEDCAQITTVTSEPPITPWAISTTATAGDYSLQSANIDDSQQSCLVFTVSFATPTLVQFMRRVNSQLADELHFAADGERQSYRLRPFSGTALRDWQRELYIVQPDVSRLSWCYTKDGSGSEGEDKAWIDDLSFASFEDATLNRELFCLVLDMSNEDCAQITTVTSEPGITPWAISTTATAGDYSLQSPPTGPAQSSCLIIGLEFQFPLVIRFSLRIDTERNDSLRFSLERDSVNLDIFSAGAGNTLREWEPRDFFIAHEGSDFLNLRFCFSTSFGGIGEPGRAWIDDMSILPLGEAPLSNNLVCQALDMSNEDCAQITSVTSDPPARPWQISTTATAGGTSLQSANIDDSQQSCLVFTVSFATPTLVQFMRRVNSQLADELHFVADGERQSYRLRPFSSTALRDWQRELYIVQPDVSRLSWCYTKDGSGSEGEDKAWIDDLSFASFEDATLNRELFCLVLDLSPQDCPLITSVTSDPPDLPWFISSITEPGGGATSLRSAGILDDQTSCLVARVSLPDNRMLRFSLRTSSASGGFLYFEANGFRLVDRFQGTTVFNSVRSWESQEQFVTDGSYDLRWCYTKDGGGEQGDDAGWLNRLSFNSVTNLTNVPLSRGVFCQVLDLSPQDCQLITSVTSDPPDLPWFISSITNRGGGPTSLRSAGILDNQTSCLVARVSLPDSRMVRFWLRTSSDDGDFLYFEANGFRLVDRFQGTTTFFQGSRLYNVVRGWTSQNQFIADGSYDLRWCYTKNGRDRQGDDTGWLNRLSFNSVTNLANVPLSRGVVCQVLDMSVEDCALISRVVSNPRWTVSATAIEGGTSLRSRAINDGQASCLLLLLPPTLPANSVVSVAARTSSEGGADRLEFFASRLTLDIISAEVGQSERDWRQQNYFLTEAVTSLRWCYEKNGAAGMGEDAAWIDNLSFSTSNLPYQRRICDALDISLNNCAMIQSVANEPSASLWVITEETAVAGNSSMRSAGIEDGQQTCLVLNLSLTANSVVTVAGRTSSEGGADQLQIFADNQRLDTISAEVSSTVRGWSEQSYFLPAAASALRWCYVKNEDTRSGFDAAWIDNLSFGPSNTFYRRRICNALDLTNSQCSLIQSVSYDPPESLWVITTETAVAGGSSLRSGDIDDDQQSCLVLNLSLAANSLVTVAGRTSSEGGADQLQIFADNQHLDTISAEVNQTVRDWSEQIYFLPATASTLRWCYVKNEDTRSGFDAAWIDNLSFETPDSYRRRICNALDLTSGDCSLIRSVSYDPPESLWVITTETSVAGGSSLRNGDIDDGQQSCLVLGLSLPNPALIRFSLRSSSEAVNDSLYFETESSRLIDGFTAAPDAVLRDWEQQQEFFISNRLSSMRWCYTKNDSLSAGNDSVWLDQLSFNSVTNLANLPLSRELVCHVLDMSNEDCARITRVSSDPGSRRWLVSSSFSTEGGSSMQSPSTDDRQQSCLVLSLDLPANAEISVAARTDSEGAFDQLHIEAGTGNLRLNTISAPQNLAERDWRQESYYLPEAVSRLRWCYSKNFVSENGSDAAWIDNLSFSTSNITYRERICAALDLAEGNCAMIQSIRYDPFDLLWIITDETDHRGGTSLRSADPRTSRSGSDPETCIEFELALPANALILASGRVSAESLRVQLRVNADNLRLDTITPARFRTERAWRQERYYLQTAVPSLRWCSVNTFRGDPNGGQNTSWIDNLLFVASNIPYRQRICLALDLTDRNCSLIQSVTYSPSTMPWIITDETADEGPTSLRSARIGRNQQSCLTLALSLPADSEISVAARTSSEGGADQLLINANSRRLDTISAPSGRTVRDWAERSYPLPAPTSRLRWCYSKNGNRDLDNRGEDSAWIDDLDIVVNEISLLCDVLDLSADRCSMIQSVTYEPSTSPWEVVYTDTFRGPSAFISPPINGGQNTCVSITFNSALPADNYVAFTWRVIAPSNRDVLRFQAGNHRLPINSDTWQTEFIDLNSPEATLRWCHNLDLTTTGRDSRGWLDNLQLITPADLYMIELAVVSTPVLISREQNTFAFDVEVRVESTLLPSPGRSWQLDISSVDNIGNIGIVRFVIEFDDDGVWRFTNFSEPIDPYLPSTVQFRVLDARLQPPLLATTPTSFNYSLPVRELAMLSIDAPASVRQVARDAPLEIVVTVTAADNYDIPFDPTDLSLRVEGTGNINVLQSTYALTFTAGTAQTTITVGLTSRGEAENVELSVSRGDISDLAVVQLIPTGISLIRLLIIAPAAVTQTAPDAAIDIPVTVIAIDNSQQRFQLAMQELMVFDAINTSVGQSTYALTFAANGEAQTTVTVDLADQNAAGSIELSVAVGSVEGLASVTLNPVLIQLARLSITAPEVLNQSTPDTTITIPVTVTATDNFDRPFEPENLELLVTNTDNARVLQRRYPLTFAAGTARTTITASLASRDVAGSIEVSVSSGDVSDSAVVELNPAVRELTQLAIGAPTVVTQNMPFTTIDIAVTVTARDNFNLLFEPDNLELMVSDTGNANLLQSTYALTFAAGMAEVTVNAELDDPFSSGSIELSVIGSDIESTASITLNLPPVRLARFSIAAAAALTQSTPGATIEIPVTVTATDNYRRQLEPAGLELLIESTVNARVPQSTYALSFAAGMAQATITVNLIDRDVAGSIRMSVSRGDVSEVAVVELNPAVRLLTQLALTAPAAVTQTAPDAAIDIGITVTARDNFELLFNPDALELMVSDTGNANLLQSIYALTFAAGTARTTVTVELGSRGFAGSIEVSIIGSEIESTASITLNPTPIQLARLALVVAAGATQSTPGATIEIPVTVTATNNYGNSFAPEGLVLLVEGFGNARVPQSTYALTFAAGMAQATVTVDLIDRDVAGRIRMSVTRGDISEVAVIRINPAVRMLTQLQLTAPAAVTQTAPDAAIDIGITVTARDNFGLPSNPARLTLIVAGTENANRLQGRYALTFANGTARTTITVELASRGFAGSIDVSVASGHIQSTASIILNPTPVQLARLIVVAPAAVTPSTPGAVVAIPVTVTATNNYGNSFAPTGLVLLVESIDNAGVPQSTYALSFAAGMAQATATVGLIDRDVAGSIRMSVSRGDVTDSAVVQLNLPGRSLTRLAIMAAKAVTQTAPDAAIDIGVTVTARDNFELPFNPVALELMVEGTGNASVSPNNYTLNFVGGTARTTITVGLTSRGVAGSIEVSIIGSEIESTASITLNPTPIQLVRLAVVVAAAATQSTPGAVIEIPVTVTATDNYGNSFAPTELVLLVERIGNARVPQSTYALSFAAGMAQTTVSVDLIDRDIAGSIRMSVSSGTISDSAVVGLNPAVRLLTRLTVTAPAAVTQSAPDATIDIAVTVTARDNFDLPFNPDALELMVKDTGNANLLPGNYVLTFVGGTAKTTITVGLTSRGVAGSIEMSVTRDDIESTASIILNPTPIQLARLAIVVAAAATPSTPGAVIAIPVTVTATDNYGNSFEPTELVLLVERIGNARVPQSTYALSFAAGMAQTTVTVDLIDRDVAGSIEVSVSRGTIQSTTSVTLNPAVRLLTRLTVRAPAAVTQSTPGATIDIGVTVTARDNFALPFNPDALELMVKDTGNANLLPGNYTLTFVGGTARTTVTVGLTSRGVAGSIEASVTRGNIESTALITLNPAPIQLARLAIVVAAGATQSTPGAVIAIAVTVTATDNYGNSFAPTELVLLVERIGNARVPQSTYALSFAAGTAQTTVTVDLTDRDAAGSIRMSVSSGTISDSAVVELNPAVRLLTQLAVMAPAAVTQSTPGATIDIAVTVTARDNFDLPFNPNNLELMVKGTGNANPLPGNYTLSFVGGMAQTTVTVDLIDRDVAGSIEVSVSSADVQSTASVTLNPAVRLLTQISVTAPAAVTQSAPGAAIDIVVTVTARDNFELPFEPTGLTLMVSDTDNANLLQSTYALTFTGGTARTTITVDLTSRGEAGSIEVSVASGDIQSTASITLNPAPIQLARLALVVAAAATQSTPGATIAIAVTVTATDNYGSPFNPDNLELVVSDSGNASVSPNNYVLSFAAGTAQTMITVGLLDRDSAGSIELSVSRGDVQSTASVTLNPAVRLLTQLAVMAPAAVTQSAPGAAIDIVVTVTARDNFDLPSNPASLQLMVTGTGNAELLPGSYPLTFTGGTARTTITVDLTVQGSAGSIEVSVASGNIQSTASITLNPAPVRLAALSVVVPAAVTQSTPGTMIAIAVTVTATDNYGDNSFAPTGLVLLVEGIGNASVPQSTYALSFAAGTAQTMITVGLISEDVAGSIRISVSSGTVSDSAVVQINLPGRLLTRLQLTAPAAVTQSTPGAAIDIGVTVIARDNFDLPFNPASLQLMVTDTENASVSPNNYPLSFAGGTAQTTITVELTDGDVAGSIAVSVSRGDIQSTASITLNPAVRLLTQLSVTAPATVTQTAPGAAIDIAVTVTARDNFELLFNPDNLGLMVEGTVNANLLQSTYALTFAGGTAETTITVDLTVQGSAGSIEVSIIGSAIKSTASITLNPTPVRLARLAIVVAADATQSTPGAVIEIPVTVTALDNYDNFFEPEGLMLTVADSGNASVSPNNYVLSFAAGTAQTTITVGLLDRDSAGSIELSVSRGDIQSTASVTLNPAVRLLTQLSVTAPAAATQSAPGAAIDIVVTVAARDNFELPFNPDNLELMVSDTGNANLLQSTYALTFTAGTAETMITVDLTVQGRAGSIDVSIIGSEIESTASITLNPAPIQLAVLSVVVPAAVTQSTPGAMIAIAVTVTTTDNYGNSFEPTGLVLLVESIDNASVLQSTYALSFAAGTAQTTITVGLISENVASIEVSVSSGTISDSAVVQINLPGRSLTRLQLTAPQAVTQSTPGATIDIGVTVTARDNFDLPFNPASLQLMVTGTENASVSPNNDPLSFAGGTAQTTITVGLTDGDIAGSIRISVSRGDIQSTASVTLNPAVRLLTQLSVTAPATVTQSAPGAAIDIAVTVAARDNFELLFNPASLQLMVTGTENASVPQSTYALTFAAGTAQTTITVGLTDGDIAGSIELSVNSGDVSDVASVGLNPVIRLLTQLSVTAPAAVTQSTPDATIDIAVTVAARDNFELLFNPVDLELMVSDTGNASVSQSTYALTFAGGTAETTITVGLTNRGVSGSIEVSIIGSAIESTASITLNPTPVRLERLAIVVADDATQSTPGAMIAIAVTVTALDNYGSLFEPAGLELLVEDLGNASVLQSMYALSFTAGMAQTTITVDLIDRDVAGSIRISVSSGTVSDSAAVGLNPVLRLLTQLQLTAPTEVTQSAPDAAIDIVVTVAARDNFDLPSNPAGLELMVSDTGNANLLQSTYALTFAAGTAETVITVGLTNRGVAGSIEVSIIGSEIESTASITLNPTPVRLERLAIVVADDATQSTPGAMIAIAVTVTALDNYGSLFEPAGLELLVEDLGNASVSQSTYALSFVNGTAQTTITVGLTDGDIAGSIELSVSRGEVQSTTSVTLNPAVRLLTQLQLTAPAAVTQSEPDAAIDIGVTVTARDNFELPFEPTGLTLMVSDTGNANLLQSTYALTFAAGTAETVITVGLTNRGKAGSIEVSIIGSAIESTASITLNPTPVVFAMLSITAPAVLSQSAPGAAIDLAVTVIARDNYGLLFNPAGLMLVIDNLDNASVSMSQTTYALTFATGTARTTITVSLTDENDAGSIEISVSSGTITDSAVVNFTPPGRVLTQLQLTAPAAVTQSEPDAAIDIGVTVTARDNFDLPFEPTGLTLMVFDTGDASVSQSTYALAFAAGTAETTVTVGLTNRGVAGSIEVSIIGSAIQSTASITLNPTPVRLAALLIVAPRAVTQSTPGAMIAIPVTVTATDNYGRPFEPPGLTLTVADLGNARVPQSTYALAFAAGTAETTITVGLTGRDVAGSIELSVSSGTVSDSASVDLNPALRLLTQLLVTAPAAVTQSTPDATIDIVVTVAARDNFELLFEPVDLELMVSDTGNASVSQSTYALTFAAGTAETTITVGLTNRGVSGSIEVSIIGSEIESTASIALNPTPVRLERLAIVVADAATQSTPGAMIAIAVTVTALDNYGSLFEPAGLELLVEDLGNASVPQSTYALTFAAGTAETVITVGLAGRDIAGSIRISVSSGTVSDSASVDLNPAVRVLTQLSVTAPAAVTQSAPDATIDIVVTVAARDNFELLFNPDNLELMVSDTGNASVSQSTYALTFAGGTAETTITVGLTNRGVAGSIEVSIIGSEIESTASITLNPAPIQLERLAIVVADAATQSTPGAMIAIAVTVTATDNYGNSIDPVGLELSVADSGNASVSQSTYALTFAAGTAETVITVGLAGRDIAGSIELSVSSGTVSDSASVDLNPALRVLTQLVVTAPAAVTQSEPDATIDIGVTVNARDNFDLSFEPLGLELRVTDTGNANLLQSTYALTFAAGTAETTITVGLTRRGAAGSIEVSVASGDIESTASITLNPTPIRLAVLSIDVPEAVTQSAPDAPIEIAVTVTADDNYGNPIDPAELLLSIAGSGNASVPQSTYALTFAGGIAETTITVGLIGRDIAGILELSVSSGTISGVAEVQLIPPGERLLAQLAVMAPAVVTQSVPYTTIDIAVTVAAIDNFNLPFGPPGLTLMVSTDTVNVRVLQSSYALTFTAGMAVVTVNAALIDPFSSGSIEVSVASGDIESTASITLNPAPVRLERLAVVAVAAVTQSTPDAMIAIPVTVTATDNYGRPFDPERLELSVADSGNASVPQGSYALTFTAGTAETTITVGLASRGSPGSIEVSVASGTVSDSASVTLNPAPRVLVSVSLAAASSNLVQTVANTAVAADLILTALDNYGDLFEAGDIRVQLSASAGAVVPSSLTLTVESSGTVQQAVEILPQNDLDTIVTVQILRDALDQSVQLLPDAGIQITVQALRVLRQLQLSLAGAQSPLQQFDSSVPIRANIRLIGLDQYDQPIAFAETTLTATAEPTTTVVTLNPQQLSTTVPGEAVTVLEVVFPEPLDTMITIAIANPGAGVTAPELIIQALPESRPPIRPLDVDDTGTGVTELDLVVAMRWLASQQVSTASLVVNLTIPGASITAEGIDNLQQLFTENSDRIDFNEDGRADQLDLRILLRYMAGLRGTALTEQELSADAIRIIRLLLGQP